MLALPWTATFQRWHQYEDTISAVYINQRDTVYDAGRNVNLPTTFGRWTRVAACDTRSYLSPTRAPAS